MLGYAEFMYWKEEGNYIFDEESDEIILTVQASERARRSFEMWNNDCTSRTDQRKKK